MTQRANKNNIRLVWPIIAIGALIGISLSWVALSGDSQGKINIFHLLLVYLIIPVLSITTSTLSLFFSKGFNLAHFLSAFSLGTFKSRTLEKQFSQMHLDKYWFLMQSQAAAIAFSVSSMLVFLLLLISTDMNFVWRSTILTPNHIQPFLEIIAVPWSFWQAAQPQLSLLIDTQDSRLVSVVQTSVVYGDWWKFILATQLFYSLFLRLVLLVTTKWILTTKLNISHQRRVNKVAHSSSASVETDSVVVPLNVLTEAAPYNNWHHIPDNILQQLEKSNDYALELFNNDNEIDNSSPKHRQIVLVKSWEAPLAELADYLQSRSGYLMIVDWNKDQLCVVKSVHLSEWQRFIQQLDDWQLVVYSQYMPNKES